VTATDQRALRPQQRTVTDTSQCHREAAVGEDRQVKMMRMRYAGTCACGTTIPAGARGGWDKAARAVICLPCLDSPTAEATAPPALPGTAPWETVAAPRVLPAPALTQPPAALPPPAPGPAPAEAVEVGIPGASLKKEYQRRSDARTARIRGKHPKIGGLILALSDDPASTTAFAKGAIGEESVARRLEKYCGEAVLFLHNRRLGAARRDGDIDHIAIAASGVYIIDAKRYKDAAIEVRRTGGLFSPRVEKLFVAGRDRTKLLDGLDKQRAAVTQALASYRGGPIPRITTVLCFVDANLPLFGTLSIGAVPLLGPRGTSKLLRQPGKRRAAEREALHRQLAELLPPA